MNYCISDLHGRYDLYLKMLERIGFSEEDRLYILGDFVDRGEDGFKIILDCMNRDNVIPIVGNHDLTAMYILSRLNAGIPREAYADMEPMVRAWMMDGGRVTYNAFKALDKSDRRLVIAYMDNFRNFAEVEVGGNIFVLCHGGIDNFCEDKPMEEYDLTDLVFCRMDYSRDYFKDRYLVTGHTPTVCIEGATEGRIYRRGRNIAIDCGAVFGHGLGCLCLDTLEEFYVR